MGLFRRFLPSLLALRISSAFLMGKEKKRKQTGTRRRSRSRGGGEVDLAVVVELFAVLSTGKERNVVETLRKVSGPHVLLAGLRQRRGKKRRSLRNIIHFFFFFFLTLRH
jgi:hypothetical protein